MCFICGKTIRSSEKRFLRRNYFRTLTELARKRLPKKKFTEFYRSAADVTNGYLTSLKEDIDLFCRKFDYRYQDEPWGNAKDSVERAVKFLGGDIHREVNRKNY